MNEQEYFKGFSSAILNFTTHYRNDVVLKIIDNEDYVDEPKRFFYTLIHKSVSSLEASNIFIRNFEIKRNYNSSAFILLRSIISDIILAEFVIKKAKTDEDRATLITRIYFDHIDNILVSLRKSAQKAYGWDDQETKEKIQQIKKSRNQYFNADGTAKLTPLRTSPYTLISQIFSELSNPLATEHDLLRRSYDLYSQFSKFEHFGDLSFLLVHRAYKDDSKQTVHYDLYDGVRMICLALVNYMNLWDTLPNSAKDEIQKLSDDVNQFDPSLIKYT